MILNTRSVRHLWSCDNIRPTKNYFEEIFHFSRDEAYPGIKILPFILILKFPFFSHNDLLLHKEALLFLINCPVSSLFFLLDSTLKWQKCADTLIYITRTDPPTYILGNLTINELHNTLNRDFMGNSSLRCILRWVIQVVQVINLHLLPLMCIMWSPTPCVRHLLHPGCTCEIQIDAY